MKSNHLDSLSDKIYQQGCKDLITETAFECWTNNYRIVKTKYGTTYYAK